jgi:hypothetical protein
MKKLSLAILVAASACVSASAHAEWLGLSSGWYGAGVRYSSYSAAPVYVYLVGVSHAPVYPSTYSFPPGYVAYVSDYYPPRYFEPEFLPTRVYVRSR